MNLSLCILLFLSRYFQISYDSEFFPENRCGTKAFAEMWDSAVIKSDRKYGNSVHNIVTNNCHHHSAEAISNMGPDMSMLRAWWIITTRGKWVTPRYCLANYLPTIIFYIGVVAVILLIKFL